MSCCGTIKWRGAVLDYACDVTNWGSDGSWDEPPEGVELEMESLEIDGANAMWLLETNVADEILAAVEHDVVTNAQADYDQECDE